MNVARTTRVREMRRDDAAGVAELATQLGYPATERDLTRRFTLISGRPDAHVLVAEDTDGKVVGWIHVQVTYLLECDTRAEIWGLVVAESVRGTGTGRALVEAAEAWVLARGLDVIALRSNTARVHTRGFYEHLGYTVVKTQNAFRKTLK